VTVRGVVTARAAKTSHRGNDYTTFKLTDGGDAVSVFSWGVSPCTTGIIVVAGVGVLLGARRAPRRR